MSDDGKPRGDPFLDLPQHLLIIYNPNASRQERLGAWEPALTYRSSPDSPTLLEYTRARTWCIARRTAKGLPIEPIDPEGVIWIDSLSDFFESAPKAEKPAEFYDGIVRNKVLMELRKLDFHPKPLDPTLAVSERTPSYMTAERKALIDSAYEQLTDVERKACLLCMRHDLNSTQAADILRTTPAAVRQALSRGRRKLASVLQAAGPDVEQLVDDDPLPIGHPDPVKDRPLLDTLKAMYNGFPSPRREIAILWIRHWLDPQEIGDVLDIPVPEVQEHQQRILEEASARLPSE